MPIDDKGKPLPEDEQLPALKDWVDEWDTATAGARALSERDRDWYDGQQWTAAELAVLKDRRQAPTVINRIAPKINAVLGHEVRTRVDPDALPRTPAEEDSASVATDAIRYVFDKANFEQVRAQVAESMAIEGYGGCILGLKVRGKDIDITITHAPWDRIIYDPHSRRFDFSDAKYFGVATWMHLDDANAEYPDAQEAIAASFSGQDDSEDTLGDRPSFWADQKRKRVRRIELYYQHAGKWYYALFTSGGLLQPIRALDYQDDMGDSFCPVLLASSHSTRENERYGLVRNMIGPQEEINKRRSKMLHLLVMRQAAAEDGAVIDIDNAKAELAKPDGWVRLEDGALRDGSFQLLQAPDMAQGHFQLLQEAKSEIDAVGPGSQQMLDVAEASGRTAILRQRAATLELEPFFDHLRDWQCRVAEHVWYLAKQYWTYEKWIGVRDDAERKGWRFVGLNRKISKIDRVKEQMQEGLAFGAALANVNPPPEAMAMIQGTMQQAHAIAQQGQQIDPKQVEAMILQQLAAVPGMNEPMKLNDISRVGVDIVLTEAPDTAVIEQEQFDRIVSLAQAQPGLFTPEEIIEASQLRNKRALLERRAEQQEQDPAQAQMAQQMAQLQAQLIAANAQLLQAQAQQAQAQAAKYAADAEKIQTETQIGIPAEAAKDMAIAQRHVAEADGEQLAQVQSADNHAKEQLGGPMPLPAGGGQ